MRRNEGDKTKADAEYPFLVIRNVTTFPTPLTHLRVYSVRRKNFNFNVLPHA